MVFANLLVLQEAALDSITGDLHPNVDIPTLVILCTGTLIKAVLFIICRSRNTSASRVLAMDQRNDCITNLVALGGAYIGHRFWKYADPIGATLVSGFIIITWLMTVREQVPLLVGKTASPQLINRIVNVAISHDERIKHLDTVYVYHFGANFLVELHVVMDREITLCEAHDVSETLQAKLEQLSFVERAFVHCDYQFDGDEHV
ncbi:cation efflux family protein [Necator americanus]|uniref:Cation efflux family protein n=1 Tax=Necator americanus TaxID=51031 RepID=W2TDR0_NECAM|nr:cation efflux family protein [Necator americanus]ETN79963.1 cation efflux family protein [Necator americanus]